MKKYIKNGVIKPRNKIVIIANGMQTINPTHEMLVEDGWAEYVTPEPTEKVLRAREIESLKRELENTDYKVIKCMEAMLVGEEMPYDVTELHTERQALRDRINVLESLQQ